MFIVDKISKSEINTLRSCYISYVGLDPKKNTIQQALDFSKTLSNRTPNGLVLPKSGSEASFLRMQKKFYEIIFKKKILSYLKLQNCLVHFPASIRIASDNSKRNYDSRIPHFDQWVGEPNGLLILSLNLYQEKDGACLQILNSSNIKTAYDKKLKKFKKLNIKIKPLKTQNIGEVILMKDCYHRTFGGFGRRLSFEARFIPSTFNFGIKKNSIQSKLAGYFPIHFIDMIKEENLKFINSKNNFSKRLYPVDFQLTFK